MYGSRSLRGLCGFCARVELGGFMTCCVFAFLFISLQLFFVFFAFSLPIFRALPLLSSSCSSLVLSLCFLWVLGFLFPLRTIREKKGHKVLLLVSSLVLLWVALFENRSGFFISYSCRPLALLERSEKRRYMWQFWNKYHKAIH